MPRPPRCRRICGAPQVDTFCPSGCEDTEPILLTLDEYKVIRLVDLERQTHEQCATQMDISRSTVQEIYESAWRKIGACLVHGKPLTMMQFCGRWKKALRPAQAAQRSAPTQSSTAHRP